jgi:hypothetical protein
MNDRFAGSGTTSTTPVYLLYALSRPRGHDIQEKLRQELQNTGASDLQASSMPLNLGCEY